MGGKGAALLVAASILAAIPSCSADANTTALAKKPKASLLSPVDTDRRVAVFFPLQGNVYPSENFYVQMSFGKSQNLYSMDIDTGSDVPWLPCQVPPQAVYPQPSTDKLIRCDDPRCKAVHASTHQKHKCKSPTRCDFKVEYHDGSSAEGVLIADTVALRLTDRSVVYPSVAFGCMRAHSSNPNGMLGLGSGEISIVSQLSSQGVLGKVIGHCLYSIGGGVFFLGDAGLPRTGINWAPMTQSNYYSLGSASLFSGSRSLGSSRSVLLDSGTTYTFFALQPYNNFISALTNEVSKQPLTRVNDHTLPCCWKGPKPFKSMSDVKQYFEASLELRFADGGASMTIPPENYLIISNKGNACLGILNGTEAGLDRDVNLIGDISMLDRLVIYDNDKRQIGWGSCDGLRKSVTSLL
ncbi:aspartic proteinase Asp1 [Cocos nucifera]|uniref:Aspartic proteinase Asp1 n=1 Tax=Cocos nucifera TaxID=13894 RepID=A0A8K0MXF9_COCNU|nr:aspartic proteinase Asp1 [Cocos nucifera]